MTKPAAFWIGPNDSLTAGAVGFLVSHKNVMTGHERHDVRDLPAHTNRSHEPRLYGWCGSFNDVATHGCGMVRVERIAKNGRAYVRRLDGDALRAALNEFGYPALISEIE